MNNIDITNCAIMKDKNTSIISFKDESNIEHPIGNKFVFNHKNSKFKFLLNGGNPLPITCLKEWKHDKAPRELLSLISAFKGYYSNEKVTAYLSTYRQERMPYDDTPLSPVFREFGIGSQIGLDGAVAYAYNGFEIDDFLKMPEVKEMRVEKKFAAIKAILKNAGKSLLGLSKSIQFSDYNAIKTYYEKITLKLLDKNNILFIRALKDIKDFTANVYYNFPEDKEKQFLTSFTNIEFKSNKRTTETLPVNNIPFKTANKEDYSIYENKRGIQYFANKTERYILLKNGLEELIVDPFGILEDIHLVNYNVFISPYFYTDVQDINHSDSNYSNFPEGTSYISGFYILSGYNAYLGNGITIKPKNPLGTQLGPMEVSLFNVEEVDNYFLLTHKKNTHEQYEVKFINQDIFCRRKGEVEYENLLLKDDYFVTNENVKIGKKIFKIFESKIEYTPGFIQAISYVKSNNNFYKGISEILDAKGLTQGIEDYFLDFVNYRKFYSCKYCEPFNKISYKPYEIIEILKYSDEKIIARNAKLGDIVEINKTISHLPGLFSEKGMIVVGGGILETDGNIYDDIFYNFRTYKKNKVGNILYYIVKYNNKRHIIGFPVVDKIDSFITPKSGEASKWGSRNTGFYDLYLKSELYPELFYTVVDYHPFGKTLKDVKTTLFETIVPDNDVGTNLIGNITLPKQTIIGDITPMFFGNVSSSSVVEYLDKKLNYSQILEKEILIIKEAGIVLDNSELKFSADYKTKIIKDKNKRGLNIYDDNKSIEIYIDGNYNDTKYLNVIIKQTNIDTSSKNDDKSDIMNFRVEYFPFILDPDGNLVSSMPRVIGPIMEFVYEGLINYLVENGVFVNILVDVDESKGMIDENKVDIKLVPVDEGSKIEATLNNKRIDICNTPGTVYYIKYKKPFPVFGNLTAYVTKDFLFRGFRGDTNEKLKQELIDMSKGKGTIYANYDLFSYIHFFEGFSLFFDTNFLALEEKTFEVPKDQRVRVDVNLGYSNTFKATAPFNTQDDMYSVIRGVCLKNKFDFDKETFDVNYYKVIDEIFLNRDIVVDTSEQATWFGSYYNNAKAQLIQDLREDTNQKRTDGAFTKVTFDTSEIYNQIKTLDTSLWAVPTNFRCSNVYDELVLKDMIKSELYQQTELTFNECFNSFGTKSIFFEGLGDEVTISLDNTFIENFYNASYDVTNVINRLNQKELLYNEDNCYNYVYNDNYSKKELPC